MLRALGRVEIGRDERIDAHDDKAPRIARHICHGTRKRLLVRAEHPADRSADKQQHEVDERAAGEVDDHTRAKIPLEILRIARAVALPEQRLQPARDTEKDRRGKRRHIADDRIRVHSHIAEAGKEHVVRAQRRHRDGKLRDRLRRAAQQELARKRTGKLKPTHTQPAAPQEKVRRYDQHTAGLRDTGRNGRAHQPLLQREHKQPVQKNVDDRGDRRADAHEYGRAVVAAVVIHKCHHGRRHGKERIPEQIIAHEPVIGLVRAEQGRDLRRQADADQHHDERDRQRAGKRVHERLIRARDVPAADAHGRDRHAADDHEHDKRIEHHHIRPH